MNITYDTIRGSRIVTAKDQGALILRTGTVYDGIGREPPTTSDLLLRRRKDRCRSRRAAALTEGSSQWWTAPTSS